MRILSGIQSSGVLHIGNYFGMMRPAIALQAEGEAFYFIADYHALTTVKDPAALRENNRRVALDFLACGLDPERGALFLQSDVPQVTELTWILSTVTPMGLLERAHSYKDKVARGMSASAGLFTYPVLMAADILLYQTDLVPVGQDQKQHLELTRDLAERFNRDFGETFKLPDPFIPKAGASIKSLQDPAKKMSKSDENANGSIFLLDDADTIVKKFKRAVTDSGTEITFDESRPAITNLLTIYQILSGKTTEESVAHFEGKGYGAFKTELAEATIEFLRPFQERVKQYDDETLNGILSSGAVKARSIAADTLADVYAKTGIR